MVRLYIENEEVELDKTVTFAITKSFEDLANPTNIKNDWSKTVAIPFTTVNHRIFGHIYSPDKAVVSGSNSYTGIYFDPLKKLDFRLEWDSTVMMTGYAKMNTITQKDGSGTYNITLFGQLGKVFQEMSKITFDQTSADTEYIINGSEYVDEYINKEFVKDSWHYSGQSTMDLKKKGTSGYSVHDIIGFAPNNSFVEGFDYNTFQAGSNSALKFADYLDNNLSFKSTTGMSASTVIPNGFLPREYGDFRSYMQLPFIYFNKLFQIFQEKAEAITGYTFELDNEWFNTANPYWYNLVYMLKSFNPKNGNVLTNKYTGVNSSSTQMQYNAGSENYLYNPGLTYPGGNPSWNGGGYIGWTVVSEAYQSLENGNTLRIGKDAILRITTVPVQLSLKNSTETYWTQWRQYPGIYPIFELSMYDENNNLIPNSTKVIGLKRSDDDPTTGTQGWYNFVNEWINSTGDGGFYVGANSTYTFNLSLPYNKSFTYTNSPTYKMRIRYKFVSKTGIGLAFEGYAGEEPPQDWQTGRPAPIIMKVDTSTEMNVEVSKGVLRSNVGFTLNDLWNNDYNLFDQIINYCKMYRIIIYVDEVNKKIVFTPFTNYFKNYEVLDWINKIDKSKEFIVTPVTFDTKYVLFNYKDIETKIGKDYKDKFGINWGEYRLATDYNFNTDKTDLFKNIKNAIVDTDNVLSWINVANKRIVYSFPAEILVDNKDKDRKNIDMFGCMLFNSGRTLWPVGGALRIPAPFLTDDTPYMSGYSTYFYSMSSISGTIVDYYQKLDVVKGDNMCVFNIPKENYTYLNNYSGKHSIYHNLWKEYLDERYNVQNKKVTCYVKLTPSDWCNFKFNKFVKFGNQLYIVNKIYDYDIQETSTTKVDLITVQNLSAYTYNQFLVDLDQLVLHFIPTSYISGNINDTPSVLGTFDTLSDVTFANGSKTYTAHGVTFTIQGNSVFYQRTAKYVDKADASFNVTLKNAHYTDSFHCVRYSVYPYPEIKLYESDGVTERSTIYPGTRNYKLAWYGTETYGIENIPNVSISINGTGSAVIVPSTWQENQCMIAEGDDEWFRTEYVVNFNTNMTNYSGSYVRVTMTDVEGWHDTKDFPVSI